MGELRRTARWLLLAGSSPSDARQARLVADIQAAESGRRTSLGSSHLTVELNEAGRALALERLLESTIKSRRTVMEEAAVRKSLWFILMMSSGGTTVPPDPETLTGRFQMKVSAPRHVNDEDAVGQLLPRSRAVRKGAGCPLRSSTSDSENGNCAVSIKLKGEIWPRMQMPTPAPPFQFGTSWLAGRS